MSEPQFDRYQQNAIDARKNSVVSAGAGSGKTTVLAERFSAIVLDQKTKVGVDQILTLTFTKKATVEMSARIYKVLKKHNPKKAADFFKANIKTLDGYCNSIAKIGCHYYGISPDFSEDNEKLFSAIHDMALPYILEHRNNEALKVLLTLSNFEEIAEELFVNPILKISTVAEPVDFDAMLHFQAEEITRRWNASVKKINAKIIELEKKFINICNDANPSLKSYIAYDSIFGATKSEEIPEPLIISVHDVESYNIEKTENYILKIKKIADLPKPGNAKGLKELGPAITHFKEELFQELSGIFNFIYGYKTVLKILPLMKNFQDKVNSFKRTSGLLSFNDISNMAKCILRDYPEIRQIEKEKYKFIMIDEFQDNNKDQRDMLFMLAEKISRHEKGIPEVDDLENKKLFFVGDEKQSIYRFRGADVSIFNALSDDFKDGNLNMTTNYRSDSALIKGFNTIFGGFEYPLPEAPMNSKNAADEKNATKKIPSVFFSNEKKYETEIPKYEAVYKEVLLPEKKEEEACDKSKCQEIFKPHIHFALYNQNQEVPDGWITEENAEAQWVAEKIIELTSKKTYGEIYEHKDIAILMRNYSLQPLYERTLLRNGIPYNTEVVTGFFSDGPVNDIFSILRLCAYPNDTSAYAQVLSSPFVNLSFNQVNEIIISQKDKIEPFSSDAEKILPPDAVERYNHAKSFFNELKESAKNEPLTRTVTKIWYETGYRYETIWNETVSTYSKLYDLIFELARQSEENKMTLGAFVDSVRTYKDQSEKLEGLDIPLEQQNGVHILSIHKSKGLEYPVVFIIGTHKKSMRENNCSPTYTSKKYGITINTPPHPAIYGNNPFYAEANAENKAQNAAELRRLTYVALTRAKNHVFITNGKYKPNDKYLNFLPENKGNVESIFNILEPIYNHYFQGRDDAKISGPFTRTFIEPSDFNQGKKSGNSEKEKIEFIKRIEEDGAFKKANVLIKEKPVQLYAKPSQLHEDDDETFRNGQFTKISVASKDACKEYECINKIIESTIPEYDDEEKKPAFDFTNFGTIAHAYLEAKINGTSPVISNRDIAGLENKKKSCTEILNICSLMADRFSKSKIGEKAMLSKWHKAEYDFRCRITLSDGSCKIIKGSIDLVFENEDGTYTIVDYKTNQEIKPEIYSVQLACYRQAVSQMMNIDPEKIFCFLYYLRFEREISMSDEVKKIDISSVISKMDFNER